MFRSLVKLKQIGTSWCLARQYNKCFVFIFTSILWFPLIKHICGVPLIQHTFASFPLIQDIVVRFPLIMISPESTQICAISSDLIHLPNVLDGWLRMGLLPPLGNFADISYLVEN